MSNTNTADNVASSDGVTDTARTEDNPDSSDMANISSNENIEGGIVVSSLSVPTSESIASVQTTISTSPKNVAEEKTMSAVLLESLENIPAATDTSNVVSEKRGCSSLQPIATKDESLVCKETDKTEFGDPSKVDSEHLPENGTKGDTLKSEEDHRKSCGTALKTEDNTKCKFIKNLIKTETEIKDEMLDGCKEYQQNRNLFDTVGLVLKPPSVTPAVMPSVTLVAIMPSVTLSVTGTGESDVSFGVKCIDDTVHIEGSNLEYQDSSVQYQDSAVGYQDSVLPEVEVPAIPQVPVVPQVSVVTQLSAVPAQVAVAEPAFCRFCGFAAPSVEIYEKHIKQHDKSRCKFGCYICAYKYSDRKEIIEHYRANHGLSEEKLRYCETCKFVTSDQQNHTDHIRNHFLIRPHACGVCYTTFVTSSAYHTHMEVKHSSKDRSAAGYIPRRRRGDSVNRPMDEHPLGKRMKQNSGTKTAARQVGSNNKSAAKSEKEPNRKPSSFVLPNYYVLPTKSIVLTCSFCDVSTESKRELRLHLLSTHRHEVITMKPSV